MARKRLSPKRFRPSSPIDQRRQALRVCDRRLANHPHAYIRRCMPINRRAMAKKRDSGPSARAAKGHNLVRTVLLAQSSQQRARILRTWVPYQRDLSRGSQIIRQRLKPLGKPQRILGHLLKQEQSTKRSMRGKRLKAGWDERYLAQVLCGC